MERLNNLYYLIYLLSLPLFSQELGDITIYNTDNSGLCYNQVNCIELGPNNELWVGTENGLNVLEENGNWLLYDALSSQLSSNTIRSIEWAPNSTSSTMFIGTNNGSTAINGGSWNSIMVHYVILILESLTLFFMGMNYGQEQQMAYVSKAWEERVVGYYKIQQMDFIPIT